MSDESSEENPYAFQSTALTENDREVFSEEAQIRVLESMYASHIPIRRLSVVCALLTPALWAFVGLTAWGVLDDLPHLRGAELVIMTLLLCGLVALSILVTTSSVRLWSAASAIGRAKQRLSLARLVSAVELQARVWKTAARYGVMTISAFIAIVLVAIVSSLI